MNNAKASARRESPAQTPLITDSELDDIYPEGADP